MFYKTGVDITNDKQMFNFLKEHFVYPTLNAWNRCESIANKVKIYTLSLSGNCWNALDHLNNGEYDTLSFMIQDWEREHPTYEVYFNGRSSGYLVLKDRKYNGHILPDIIVDNDDYEEYKECCRDNFGSVKANRDELVYYTKLVQDFDKLCDELRDYVDRLSNLSFEVVEMEKSVERFNEEYYDDLDLLGFKQLHCDGDGKVDISEICAIKSLSEAFFRIADRRAFGYEIKSDENGNVGYAS